MYFSIFWKEEYLLAEKSYSSAISINPNRFGPIYKNRGIVRLKLDNKEGAISDLNTYLDQCPQANDKNNIELAIKDLSSKKPWWIEIAIGIYMLLSPIEYYLDFQTEYHFKIDFNGN